MARAFWNGTNIIVTVNDDNEKHLIELSKKYNAQKILNPYSFAFVRSRESLLDISTLENTVFDESFEKMLSVIKRKENEKLEFIKSLNFPDCMYPYQKDAVAQLLRWNHNALLASEQGMGKSLMASMWLNKGDLYPALIICPASLKFNWAIEIEKWTPGIKTCVISGRDSYRSAYILNKVKEADVIIINYDILGVDDKEAQKKEKERIKIAKENGYFYRKAFIPVSGWVDYLSKMNLKAIVSDECQAIESQKAVRTRGVIQLASDKNIKKLLMSGTPFETRVSQFYTACHIIAPELFPKEFDFKQRYCNPKRGYKGYWVYDGVSNLAELRQLLSTFMIRQKKEDFLTQLPPKQKIPIYFDMDEKARKSYDQMEDELLAIKDGIHQFSFLAKMKEALMEVKVEPTIQFIKDMLDIEDKLVVFTYHNSMYDTLMNQFGNMAVGINGNVKAEDRQKAIDKFQNDSKIKIFIGQIQAASTGITLTASHTVIFAEWGNTVAQHMQAEDRIHRLGQNADRCVIYYLIVKDTVDEAPYNNLSNHFNDINAVINGDTKSTFVDTDHIMIAKVKERKLMKNKKGVQIEYD